MSVGQPAGSEYRVVLPVLVSLAVLILYFPPALAWRGPLFEAGIHLNALHRMSAGELPFRDFEFLYGPLMAYIPWLWTKVAGLSLQAYFSYILVLELITMLLLLAIVQRYVRNFWAAFAAFTLMSALYVNVMLGPNQNGFRRLLAVIVLLIIVERPLNRSTWLLSGIGLGVLLGYSQETGAAAAIATGAIYAALFVKRRELTALVGLVSIAAISAVTWFASIWLLLGEDWRYYFSSLQYLTSQFDSGEAAFPFFWTVNGLAVFALIAIAVWRSGTALARNWDEPPGAGDLLMIGGVAYAAISLKSGLSRADQWHLDPTVQVICFAFVLPLVSRYVGLGPRGRFVGIALVAVVALTASFGQFRIAWYTLYEGTLRGAAAWVSEEPSRCDPDLDPVLPAVACTFGAPPSELVELAEFLSQPPYRGRPVFDYQGGSTLAAMVGAPRGGYLTDEFIYGDQRAAETQEYLEGAPEVIVVIREDDLEWLRQGPDAPFPAALYRLGGSERMRQLRTVLSSVHNSFIQDELEVQRGRWRTFIGNWLVEAYEPANQIGRFVILERKGQSR